MKWNFRAPTDYTMTNLKKINLSEIADFVPGAGIWRDRKFLGFVDVILKSIIKNPGRKDRGF
jgi:hypothetical protein